MNQNLLEEMNPWFREMREALMTVLSVADAMREKLPLEEMHLRPGGGVNHRGFIFKAGRAERDPTWLVFRTFLTTKYFTEVGDSGITAQVMFQGVVAGARINLSLMHESPQPGKTWRILPGNGSFLPLLPKPILDLRVWDDTMEHMDNLEFFQLLEGIVDYCAGFKK